MPGVVPVFNDSCEQMKCPLCGNLMKCDENGHEFVDLGISVKWATCNMEANKPDEFGDYYALSALNGMEKKDIEQKIISFNDKTALHTNKIELKYDVAHIKWGGGWHIPSCGDFQELLNECSWRWVSKGSINGYEISGKKRGYRQQSIFLPASGWLRGNDHLIVGHGGGYRSSSLNPRYIYGSYCLRFYSDRLGIDLCSPFEGLSVRPVCG